MEILENILGNSQQRSQLQDFANRFEQGAPSEGYSDQEVTERYNQVAKHLPHNEYVNAAMQAMERLTPQQRQQIAHQILQQGHQHGLKLSQYQGAQSGQMQSSDFLAQLLGSAHQQQPGIVGELLGGTSGGLLSNPAAKAAMAGIVAMAAKRMMG